MSPRNRTRTQLCARADAVLRLENARKFLEVAELLAEPRPEDPPSASVSAALAVLAGIAASDAACCAALGRRARGQDHHEAETVLAEIVPGGKAAANKLKRLMDLKDTAHDGLVFVSGANLTACLRQAADLVAFARDVVTR